MNERQGTVENIQALRGVAALLVLYVHVRMLVENVRPDLDLFHAGGIGVDLFFIISGFVICLTASKRHHTAGNFILARIARVVPLYFAITLLHIAFHLVLPAATNTPVTLKAIWNGFFFLPVFDTNAFTPPPIFVGWSLSFEMWFYLAFAACLLFCRPARAATLFPPLIALAVVAGLAYRGDWYLPRFLTHPFALEFAFGCIIYQVRHYIRGTLPWILLALAAAYVIFLARGTDQLGFILDDLDSDPLLPWLRVILWGVPMALIVAALVGFELTRNFVLPRVLTWLGTISYSLYLSHWPTIQFLTQIFARSQIRSPWIIAPVAIIVCLIVAPVCYYLLERPLTMHAQALVNSQKSRNASEVNSV